MKIARRKSKFPQRWACLLQGLGQRRFRPQSFGEFRADAVMTGGARTGGTCCSSVRSQSF